jgi:hypothetical protein
MLRTLGFLSGVGLSIAGFLLMLEPADLLRIQASTTSALAQILPQQRDSFGPRVGRLRDALRVDESRPAHGDPPAPQPIQGIASGAEKQPADPERLAGDPSSPTPPRDQTMTAAEQTPVEVEPPETPDLVSRNHLFWSPFRSEPAARGFADRLSSATDVAVLVVEAGPASYRVGFSHRDDAERRALIERIETVTGLELE